MKSLFIHQKCLRNMADAMFHPRRVKISEPSQRVKSSAANRLLAGVMHDWDGLRPSAEDTSPATEASCAPANSLPLVTAGFHALTSNYGWESFRMEASPDWAQWTLNSIKAVMGIVYHGHGARPPPFRTSFLIFHLYYIARSILSTHCVFVPEPLFNFRKVNSEF